MMPWYINLAMCNVVRDVDVNCCLTSLPEKTQGSSHQETTLQAQDADAEIFCASLSP